MSVVYAASAAADLKHIWVHCAERISERVASDLVRRIRKTLEKTIGHQKRAGRSRPEFGNGCRSIPVPPYVAFYLVDSRGARVIRVLHGRRDIRPPLMSLLAAA